MPIKIPTTAPADNATLHDETVIPGDRPQVSGYAKLHESAHKEQLLISNDGNDTGVQKLPMQHEHLHFLASVIVEQNTKINAVVNNIVVNDRILIPI